MSGPTLYDDYIAFKGWEADEPGAAEDYAALLAPLGAKRGRVLDIGYGRGELLDWAKSQGFETYGVELIPELVERARTRGHVAGSDVRELQSASFEAITAIDVLEHLTLDQLRALLADVKRLLKPNGVFIARFPNGQSPFSGLYQHGDLTHLQYLTPSALGQVARSSGMGLVEARNFRPIPAGLRGLKRRLGYAVRDLIEVVIGFSYFGHRVPLDANIMVILRPHRPLQAELQAKGSRAT